MNDPIAVLLLFLGAMLGGACVGNGIANNDPITAGIGAALIVATAFLFVTLRKT